MTDIEARFILGLGPTFSSDDLKHAYRKTAADNHPDRGGNPERMVLVNEAFEILTQGLNAPAYVSAPPTQAQAPAQEEWTPYEPPASAPQPIERVPHPLQKYVVRSSLALAVAFWIWGIFNGDFDEAEGFWAWVVVGIPFSYWILSMLVGLLVRCGIHIYNSWIKFLDWRERLLYRIHRNH